MATFLVTGAAGFIGYHVSMALLERGDRVVGLDSMTPYYSLELKQARVDRLERAAAGSSFVLRRIDLASERGMERLFGETHFDAVIHLAAQAGVRYSLHEPRAYVQSNVAGTLNVLEGCRHAGVAHLLFASSSSVYGLGAALPYCESGPANHPASLYAATKRSCELMAHSYSHLYGIPSTGVRFFTVYGPWGRPDMAYYKFALDMTAGRPIEIYGDGSSGRDMTYIGDCVTGLLRLVDRPPAPDPAWRADAPAAQSSSAPWRIYNLGGRSTVTVERLVGILEGLLGVVAVRRHVEPQPGDVDRTWADVSALEEAVGYGETTPVEEGLARFVDWFKLYHADRG